MLLSHPHAGRGRLQPRGQRRRQPGGTQAAFALLRVAGTQLATLYRVVLLETALPLAATTILAGAVAYLTATTTVEAIEPAGTPVPPPAGVYYATMAVGLVGALLVILTSLPLLRRLTAAAAVRFE